MYTSSFQLRMPCCGYNQGERIQFSREGVTCGGSAGYLGKVTFLPEPMKQCWDNTCTTVR